MDSFDLPSALPKKNIMDHETILGERFLGLLFFIEKIRLRNDGFTHNGKFTRWEDVVQIELRQIEPFVPAGVRQRFYKLRLRCLDKSVCLDSRTLLYPNDNWWLIIDPFFSGNSSAFQNAKFEIESYCKGKMFESNSWILFDFRWSEYFWMGIVFFIFVYLFTRFFK